MSASASSSSSLSVRVADDGEQPPSGGGASSEYGVGLFTAGFYQKMPAFGAEKCRRSALVLCPGRRLRTTGGGKVRGRPLPTSQSMPPSSSGGARSPAAAAVGNRHVSLESDALQLGSSYERLRQHVQRSTMREKLFEVSLDRCARPERPKHATNSMISL